jgi:hypothetical protein
MSKAPSFLSQMIRPTRQEYDSQKLPTIVKRFFAFVIGSLFVLVGLGLLVVRPWSILTCRHVEHKQTDCHLEKRIAWFLPTKERSFAGLSKVELRWERATRVEEDGERIGYLVYDVVLVNDSGEMSLAAYDESWSIIAHSVADRINNYLETSGDKPLTVWGHGLWLHTVGTLGGSFVLVLFSFALVTSVANSLLLFGAWSVECVCNAVEWVVDRGANRGRRVPKAGGRMDRLRQVVRGIAIQPKDNDSP